MDEIDRDETTEEDLEHDDDRAESDVGLDTLLEYLRDYRAADFTNYKRNTARRRVQKRMADIGASSVTDYIDLLEVDPDEFHTLFNTMLINVTGFFRDPDCWEHIRASTIPEVLETNAPDGPIRVWSAGCSSGEEAYTLGILFAEALGANDFRDRVKIYATDMDEEALLEARQANYTAKRLDPLPREYRERYFEIVGGRYQFRSDLRRNIIFGRHDLGHDAPISGLDLLVCRNVLMYFNSEMQAHVLDRLHYALKPTGFLFLGQAEMLSSHGDLFRPETASKRIFRPIELDRARDARLRTMSASPSAATNTSVTRLRNAAAEAAVVAQLVLDLDLRVVHANREARAQFGLRESDIGRPFQDLEISYRPVELRSRCEQVHSEHRVIQLRNVERPFPQGDSQFLDVVITPLTADDARPFGTSISFIDVTAFNMLQADLRRTNDEMEAAYQQLQSTNEELETTNEELQSTVEELETTNEELQSTNEELETMNEELQSTNAELEAMNAEFQARNGDRNE